MKETLFKLICYIWGHDWSTWKQIPSKDFPYWRYCKRCIEKTEYSNKVEVESDLEL